MDPRVILVALLLSPVAIFLALALVRRKRFRALAGMLGGRHEGFNPLTPGAIVGEDFRIEAVRVQKSYRTEIVVCASGAPGIFVLDPEFFRGLPNWPFARVFGSRTERVFLWEVELPALAQANREQQEQLLAWLPKPAECEGLHELLKAAHVRAIHVTEGRLSTTFRGIVSDPERIRHTLDALRRLASGSPARRRTGSRAA